MAAISARASAALPRCPAPLFPRPVTPPPHRLTGAPAQTGARAATTPSPPSPRLQRDPAARRAASAPLKLHPSYSAARGAPAAPRRRGLPSAGCSRCLHQWGARPRPLPPSPVDSVASKNPPTSWDDTARAGTGSRLPSRAPALRPESAEPRRPRTPPPAPARQPALRPEAAGVGVCFLLGELSRWLGLHTEIVSVFRPNAALNASAASSALHLTLRGLPGGTVAGNGSRLKSRGRPAACGMGAARFCLREGGKCKHFLYCVCRYRALWFFLF